MKNAIRFINYCAAALFILTLTPGAAASDSHPPLSYQGRLLADGKAVPDGEYTMSIELFRDSGATERICGDVQVSIRVTGGYFTHIIRDANCREKLLSSMSRVFVRVLASGGPFGERNVEIGMHPVSGGIFSLHAESGGGAIGDIVPSMLNPDQFITARGSGWVLADGSSHPDSMYAFITGRSTVPDLRGVFLRGRDHGRTDGRGNPAGNLELGAWQSDEVGAHEHSLEIPERSGTATDPLGPILESGRMSQSNISSVETESAGGAETRPRNVTVNFFIKIN